MVPFFLFLSVFHVIENFRRLNYTEGLLSIRKKLGLSLDFVLGFKMGHGVKIVVFFSDLFVGEKIISHRRLFYCGIAIDYCCHLFRYVVFERIVLFELFSGGVDFMVVDFLFIVFEVFAEMRVENFADGFKAIKLVFLWFDAFVLFPYRTGTHLALPGCCSCRPH